MPERQERNEGFFLARSQAPVLLKTAKKAFDFVAVTVRFGVHFRQLHPSRVAGNHRLDAMFGTVGAVFVAVIGRIGQDFAGLQLFQQGQYLWAVARLAPGRQQAHGIAQRVGTGGNFGAHSAPTATQVLGVGVAFFGPPSAGVPARWWNRA